MALIGRPDLLIADEPTTALDVSVQAQILRLLHDLVVADGLTVLMITHNLGVVAQLCTHVAVMYAGNIVESGTTRAVFKRPAHPYTRALIAAIPDPFHRTDAALARAKAKGEIASALNPPPGCHFHPRCPMRADRCSVEVPTLEPVSTAAGVDAAHVAACHFRDRTA